MSKDKGNKSLVSILATPMQICTERAKPVLLSYASILEQESDEATAEQIAKNKADSEVAVYSVEHLHEIDINSESEMTDDFKVSYKQIGRGTSIFESASPGSIAVVPVRGIMMRESGYARGYGYIVGTREIEAITEAASNSPNIDGILYLVKTPGGEAAGNESLMRCINNCAIPTVVLYEGLASAGVAAFAGADEIYALEQDSYFGSIGTYATLVDDSEFWESIGIKFLEVYAPQSTLKNYESREAVNGNQSPMQQSLEKTTNFFIKSVQKARPQMVDDGRVFKGAIYNSVEAKNIKAIEGIRDFNYVMERAAFLARKQNRTSAKKKTMQTEEQEQQEQDTVQITKADKSLLDKFKAFIGGNDSQEVTPEAQLATANQTIESLRATQVANENAISALTAEKIELQSSLASANADLAHIANATVIEGSEPVASVEELVTKFNATVEHNKTLGGPRIPSTPAGDPDTTQESTNSGDSEGNSPKTLLEKHNAIKASLKAKQAAKKEETK